MTDEIFKELCQILDDYQRRYLMSHYYIDNAINHCRKFMEAMKQNPRYKTVRSCDITWSISENLLRELYQHYAYDGEFHISKNRHYRRFLRHPISSYTELRKFFEQYVPNEK